MLVAVDALYISHLMMHAVLKHAVLKLAVLKRAVRQHDARTLLRRLADFPDEVTEMRIFHVRATGRTELLSAAYRVVKLLQPGVWHLSAGGTASVSMQLSSSYCRFAWLMQAALLSN